MALWGVSEVKFESENSLFDFFGPDGGEYDRCRQRVLLRREGTAPPIRVTPQKKEEVDLAVKAKALDPSSSSDDDDEDAFIPGDKSPGARLQIGFSSNTDRDCAAGVNSHSVTVTPTGSTPQMPHGSS
eukprot:GFYU01009830.1.p1 GENE.GFYU01009830.1~~GFYU01009830.1.p1  ORF type:complete len:139 (-),score=44.87 GFYU01009830.1:467-850(-)